MIIDLGDSWAGSVQVKDANGALAAAGAITVTITQPDGTTATPSTGNPSTGVYTTSYPTVQAGHHTVRWVATGLNASAFTDAFDVDSAAPVWIVSLADVRDRLNFTATLSDEELRNYVASASNWIESMIGPVVRRTLVETRLPNEDGTVTVSAPVISLTSVTGAYGYGGTYTVGTMYFNGTTVLPTYGTTIAYPVTVTYVGGRVIVPPLIRQATIDYVAWLWESQRGATALPLPGGEFPVLPTANVPGKIMQALEPYLPAGFA